MLATKWLPADLQTEPPRRYLPTMSVRWLALLFCVHAASAQAELTTVAKRRVALSTFAGMYTGFTVWAYFAWYHNKPGLDSFTWGGDGLFGESTYAGGADKLGHAWANYAFSRGGIEMLRAGGWSRASAAAMGAGTALLYFTFIEVKDGSYYQFSFGDATANALGAALGAATTLSPRLDALLDYRVEVLPSREYRDALAHNADVNIAEDYSGQRYLLAFHTAALPGVAGQPWAPWLTPLDLAIGFETRGYKPDPFDPTTKRRQHLFVGVSLNAQGIIDWLTRDTQQCAIYTAGRIGHGAFEVFNLPKTSLAIGGLTRSPDD